MDPIRFIMCIHNHQPVGNFDYVIEDAYQRAYRPFLEVMERHPDIPWVLHNSGCLWEWLESHHPEYIDRIGVGVAADQIELLASGFFEPVLPALTPEDRRGQILKMREYLQHRFGVDARGAWLTERVWEPDLPVDLVDAGIAYLPLDDTQLHQVGVAPERVRGAFLTESAGRTLRIFPALMSLRYRIPYAPPDEAIDFLRDPFPGGGAGLALYADDGEKFGVWPGTHKLIYQEKWLEQFLSGLEEEADRINPTTFTRELAIHEPMGLVYLPTGSYAEMGKWSLPADYQARYAQTRELLTQNEMETEADLFVRGGFWRNFFARYSESSWMHMRALEASGRCRAFRSAMKREAWEQARDHLWRAQCNCAYWHGVFGGLYLPHLRHGIYEEIIRGEALLARSLHGREGWVSLREADLDIDGQNEIILENDRLALYIAPNQGGRIIEWDDRSAEMNLINLLTRRPEHYHREIAARIEEAPTAPEAEEQAATIHGQMQLKEAGLGELLTYDWYNRAGLTDRFFDERPDPGRLMRGELHEIGDFVNQPFKREISEQAEEQINVRLWRVGGLWRGGVCQALRVEKTIRLVPKERGFQVAYRYLNLSGEPLQAWAFVENHFNLLAADAPDRFLVLNGRKARPARLGACGEKPGISELALVDGWRNWHIRLVPDRPLEFFRYPVRTVSLSEAGAESNDQGLAVLLGQRIELAAGGELSFTLSFSVADGLPEITPPAAQATSARAAGSQSSQPGNASIETRARIHRTKR